MAVFAVTYEYGPDLETRMNARPAHRTWQGLLNERGVLLASGPFDEDGGPGGLLIFSAESRAAVEDLLAQDPYVDARVIAATHIREWTPVFGPWAPAA